MTPMLARDFQTSSLPAMPQTGILCLGLHLEDAPAWLEVLRPQAAPDELARAARFAHAVDAARHLAGRALVRRVLRSAHRRTTATAFCRTPHGKPFCPEAETDFSISHSGMMVWTAFCREGAVGIDVEEERNLPDLPDLAEQLHPRECAALRRLPPDSMRTAFYRCWTRKEAVLKALGTGLSQSLQSFRVSIGPEDDDWILSLPRITATELPGRHRADARPGLPEGWTSRDIPSPAGCLCSVAACAARLEVRICTM